jgi:hypothetical protein
MELKNFIVNNKINNFINSNKKYKKYKMVYHITSLENSKNILKNGFDIKKSKTGAFGKGINLTDNIHHLKHYYSKNNKNTVILCIIKYNKLKYNTSNINDKEFFKKHGYSKPKYMYAPIGYEGLYNDDIYVMKNKKYVLPLCTINIKF